MPYPIIVYSEDCWRSVANQGIPDPGLLWAYRASPPTTATFGRPTSAQAGGARMGMRTLAGAATRFTLSSTPPNALAFLTLGFSNQGWQGSLLPAPLAPLGFPGLTLRTSIEAYAIATSGSQAAASGYARIDLPLRTLPGGVPVYAQWHWLDPNNLAAHGSTIGHAFRAQ